MNYYEIYKDKTILITGGAGAIGSNLSRKLAEAGAAKVIILDDLSASYVWNIPNLPNVLKGVLVATPRPCLNKFGARVCSPLATPLVRGCD